MKSKYNQTKPTTAEKQKVENNYDFLDIVKPFDFVGLYKTAEETNKIIEKYKTDDSTLNKDNTKNKLRNPKRESSLRKNNIKNRQQEPLDTSKINIDASSLNSGKGACAKAVNSQSNSTPNASSQGARVKSIMKSASTSDEAPDTATSPVASSKPKKRNKSVSFMLDDTEEVDIKRTKSNDAMAVKTTENTKPQVKDKKKANKRQFKKDKQENTEVVMNDMDVDNSSLNEPVASGSQTKKPVLGSSSSTPDSPSYEKKKKLKKTRKPMPEVKPETNETKTETSNSNDVTPEIKNIKKLKKKKKVKPSTSTKKESGDGYDEPVKKARKTDSNPDLAEDLENLSIGDNAHTLSSMLDEMTVVDRDKRKKMKQKPSNKEKSQVKEESENTEEVKEKVKWKKRKWNKDKKGEISDSNIDTTVVVENLPINIIFNYKKLLTDYFIRHGLIKKVGMAEMYPTEETRPVFSTTITFNSDGAAELALEENNTTFEGNRIRVKRLLPATVTTIVVRSYGELSDQNISSTFLGFGKIRSIRHLVKGKKTMATSFVEFDGAEAVESALSQKADIRIGGKRVHMSKFEPRPKKKKEKKPKNEDSAADADSEDSND